uniref:Uncharacterized protein n=1 Tax=Arundo donax TaxID=35708 RepID=A0A0A9AR44_ARUDO
MVLFLCFDRGMIVACLKVKSLSTPIGSNYMHASLFTRFQDLSLGVCSKSHFTSWNLFMKLYWT